MREKTNNLGSDQVRHKPGCTVTEDGERLEIVQVVGIGLVLAHTRFERLTHFGCCQLFNGRWFSETMKCVFPFSFNAVSAFLKFFIERPRGRAVRSAIS